jgi:hypothetical protein
VPCITMFMLFVFRHYKIDMNAVEISLAVTLAVQSEITQVPVPRQLPDAIRERLNGPPLDEVEPWAREVLATYLHAWLKESKDIRPDFRQSFRRRVFLG